MSRILFDQNVPRGIRHSLTGHEITLAFDLGWHNTENGHLIAAAEDGGFDILITADKNLSYQNNLTGRRPALVVLDANDWPTVKTHLASIKAAVDAAAVGTYTHVTFERSILRLRPFRR